MMLTAVDCLGRVGVVPALAAAVAAAALLTAIDYFGRVTVVLV
jgi:hypothetical protein